MGYDLHRFQGAIDSNLICPLCAGVLEEPLRSDVCQHTFCRSCINDWLSHNSYCPIDHTTLTRGNLSVNSQALRSMLKNLSIACNNAANGCTRILKLGALYEHLEHCQYQSHNTNDELPSTQSYGCMNSTSELSAHNCIRQLCALVQSHQDRIEMLSNDMKAQDKSIRKLKREFAQLKQCACGRRSVPFTVTEPTSVVTVEQWEQNELLRWSSTLQPAIITRWGGMISTPDKELQRSIRFALFESGCPRSILQKLIVNCHERSWPSGINTLEIRKKNKQMLEKYVCRRIPERRAVVVLPRDNPHMPANFLAKPGLVMIFAVGIE